jgi:hypothetical protein
MKKMMLGALALLGVAAVAPSTANAGVSFAVSLPGFGFWVANPFPPPPPVAVVPYYYPRRAYFAPAPVVYRGYYDRGCHRGWRHGRW